MNPKRSRTYAGWFRVVGNNWELILEGADRRKILNVLLDIVEEGEMLILPSGERPGAEQKGQFRRGPWPDLEREIATDTMDEDR